ncbi:MAG: squalene--hopene cyclase [Bryobacterales bacterium]|nr:squalene--hopene cyclase [Bryobacterales bacterium]
MDAARIESTLRTLRSRLLEQLQGDHWEGRLSSSALSTATATIALTLAGGAEHEALAARGTQWLIGARNDDGGWGDTDLSLSNISTTALCWAALTLRSADTQAAAAYMERHAGGLDSKALVAAIKRRYGKDHTFSVPILTVLAIAGLLGEDGWKRVPQLPFELAYFPQSWYAVLQLPVVSYALPALIAIGQARHSKRPSRNPATRLFRNAVREATLDKLASIQPPNGGFLEATPLTSFVSMSLIAAGRRDHEVVRRGLDFLVRSVREDGSWPIDTNLATWVTTLGVNALGAQALPFDEPQRLAIRDWLLAQQFRDVHPYTGAAPGAWAWTNLPGGVPDADDTPGALLALHRLGVDAQSSEATRAGVRWLLDLQNSDGGIPTFCRGWGALPFDRSSPDLTAHTLRAWQAWSGSLGFELEARVQKAIPRAIRFLERAQRPDGAWAPLWFGNQHAPEDENPTYGTARVLLALPPDSDAAKRGERWLLDAQNPDGSWGGAPGVAGSIEEAALAVSALAARPDARAAVERGRDWLVEATDEGRRTPPSPIGFYFAKLWYFEELYPLIFALEAFGAASEAPL